MSWPLLIGCLVGAVVLVGWLSRRALRRAGRRTMLRFRARLDRYKLVESSVVQEELLRDPVIGEAIDRATAASGAARAVAERQVGEYVAEIVPAFNLLAYYRIGFGLSKLLSRLFYEVVVDYRDEAAVRRLPKQDVVIYLMMHRSNMDYVVMTYVLGRVVSISYAVGEWARTWPLEHLFKSFGSYFIRRQFREPLYHAVLERYVQLVTRHRVTQGVFPEGGLSRDGAPRPAKIGLLDYQVGTLRDPAFDGDLWLVPVALCYDRVLEDRTLTRELVIGAPRRSRASQLLGWIGFVFWNLGLLLTGQRRRYGRVAVRFERPISVRSWLAEQPSGILELERAERLPQVQRLADLVMERAAAAVPITPVPLAAAALLSFHVSVIEETALIRRLEELEEHLHGLGAELVPAAAGGAARWELAWRTLWSRRFVVRQGRSYVILPNARPLLQYYANGIAHLLPAEAGWQLSPAAGVDETLPRLGRQGQR